MEIPEHTASYIYNFPPSPTLGKSLPLYLGRAQNSPIMTGCVSSLERGQVGEGVQLLEVTKLNIRQNV